MDLASAPRGGIKLSELVKTPVPSLGLAGARRGKKQQ